MSRRMNYGKRFRSGAISIGYRYDETLDRGMAPAPWHWNVSPEGRMYGAAKAHATRSRIGMPRFSFSEPSMSEREQAEQAAIERIKTAVAALEFMLTELMQVPVSDFQHKNCVNQLMVMDAIRKLCLSVKPPLQLHNFANTIEQHVQQQRTAAQFLDACTACGGPGRLKFRARWYCEDCLPNDPLAKASDQRRDHIRNIRGMELEASKLRRAINQVEKAMKHGNEHGDEGHGGHQGEDTGDMETG